MLQLGSVLPVFCSIAIVRIAQGVENSGLLQPSCWCQQVGSGPCAQGSCDPLGGTSLCHQHTPEWRMLLTTCSVSGINHGKINLKASHRERAG